MDVVGSLWYQSRIFGEVREKCNLPLAGSLGCRGTTTCWAHEQLPAWRAISLSLHFVIKMVTILSVFLHSIENLNLRSSWCHGATKLHVHGMILVSMSNHYCVNLLKFLQNTRYPKNLGWGNLIRIAFIEFYQHLNAILNSVICKKFVYFNFVRCGTRMLRFLCFPLWTEILQGSKLEVRIQPKIIGWSH